MSLQSTCVSHGASMLFPFEITLAQATYRTSFGNRTKPCASESAHLATKIAARSLAVSLTLRTVNKDGSQQIRDALVGHPLTGASGNVYDVRDQISEGGQGWVFRATSESHKDVVVVKVLRPDAMSADALKRFQREARVLQELSQASVPCPNVVQFLDHAEVHVSIQGSPVALPFTVLEYVPGVTLQRELQTIRGRGLPLGRVLGILRDTVNALEHVHARQIIHRDLKPSNILLKRDLERDTAKVTDFGLVKIISGNYERTAQVAGASIGYAPPEQYERGNRRVAPQTDVFSLAAIVFEMLIGREAYPYKDGENPLIVLTRILSDARPSLLRTTGHVSSALAGNRTQLEHTDRELARALDPEPNGRHASAREFLLAIEHAWAGLLDAKPPPSFDSFRSASLGLSLGRPIIANGPVSASADASVRNDAGKWSVKRHEGIYRAALFSEDGTKVLALTDEGFMAITRKGVVRIQGKLPFPATSIRGLLRTSAGDIVMFGEAGLVAYASPNLQDVDVCQGIPPEITFNHAIAEEDRVTLVGESAVVANGDTGGDGFASFVQLTSRRITLGVRERRCAGLLAVAPWRNGSYLACGKAGAVVQLAEGKTRVIASGVTIDLNALRVDRDEDSVLVGEGGHALKLAPNNALSLEQVGTQKSLHLVGRRSDGALWVACEDGRVLRRTPKGWPSASPALGINGTPRALHFNMETPGDMRIFYRDGSLVDLSAE
jgi:eukaryotic-like serine/threonine-protein kinase